MTAFSSRHRTLFDLLSSQTGWEGADLTVTLEISESGKTVSLSGSLICLARPTSGGEAAYRLAVRLTRVTPELMTLVKALAGKKAT